MGQEYIERHRLKVDRTFKVRRFGEYKKLLVVILVVDLEKRVDSGMMSFIEWIDVEVMKGILRSIVMKPDEATSKLVAIAEVYYLQDNRVQFSIEEISSLKDALDASLAYTDSESINVWSNNN